MVGELNCGYKNKCGTYLCRRKWEGFLTGTSLIHKPLSYSISRMPGRSKDYVCKSLQSAVFVNLKRGVVLLKIYETDSQLDIVEPSGLI
jgi:hypothetical protein